MAVQEVALEGVDAGVEDGIRCLVAAVEVHPPCVSAEVSQGHPIRIEHGHDLGDGDRDGDRNRDGEVDENRNGMGSQS